MEKLVEEIGFTVSDTPGQPPTIDANYVFRQLTELGKGANLRKFIL